MLQIWGRRSAHSYIRKIQKPTKVLFKLICEVLQDKGVDINQIQFNGFDGTNTMSGEISGLQL